VRHPYEALYRAVSVDAPSSLVFLWLCQLRVAPYSYDWIDNLGRRSPPTLSRGLDRIEVGQRAMTFFTVVAVEPGDSLTLALDPPSAIFGQVSITYLILPTSPARCRLVAKIAISYPGGPLGRIARALLPTGDLVMMRKQLSTLQQLAERDARGHRRPWTGPTMSATTAVGGYES